MPRHANATSFGQKSGNPIGKGPKRGAANAGRPVKVFSDAMARIAQRGETLKNVQAILDDPMHPHFMKALEFAADRGFGKEAVPLEGDITIRVVRDTIAPSE